MDFNDLLNATDKFLDSFDDNADTILCSHCGEESPMAKWIDEACPECGKTIDEAGVIETEGV